MLGLREGPADPAPILAGAFGVVAPDDMADSPALAGVDGGGYGAADVSDVVFSDGRGDIERKKGRGDLDRRLL